jgi:LytTr DNA-binding domain
MHLHHMAKKISIEIFLMMVIGLVLGLFGPFGTFAMMTGPRIGYWLVFVLVGYAIFRPLIVVGRWLSETLAMPQMVGVGLALIIAALPMTLLVANLLSGFDVAAALRWNGLPQLYFQVWLIGFLINALVSLLFDSREKLTVPGSNIDSSHGIPPTTERETRVRLEDRLSAGFGTPLALKSEDHYVRAIGSQREELILIRLRDAIDEMGAVPGMQVHRSWWVSQAAMGEMHRANRQWFIRLPRDHAVPVAREKMASLKKSGWVR